jgi:periplasmic protein TonB
MFDQTFVDGAGKTNKSWTVTLSFIAEFAAIGVMILIPLIWTEVLPRTWLANSLTTPAPAPAPPPPAPAPMTRQVRVAPRAFSQALEAPHVIPSKVAMIVEDGPLPPASIGDLASGVPGAAQTGMPGVFSSDIGIPPPSPRPSKADATPKELQAIIGKDGEVRNLTVVSAASPLLVPSAMDAVKHVAQSRARGGDYRDHRKFRIAVDVTA